MDLFGNVDKQKRIRRKREEIDVTGWPLIVQFSGGKTSAYMTRRLLDAGHTPLVIFENTGRENNETLDFVHECDQRAEMKWAKDLFERATGGDVIAQLFRGYRAGNST